MFKTPEEAIAYLEGNHGQVARMIASHPEGVIGLLRDHPEFCQKFLNDHVFSTSVPSPIGVAPPPPPPPPMGMLPPPPARSVSLPGNGETLQRQLQLKMKEMAGKSTDIEKLVGNREKKSAESPTTNPAGSDAQLLAQLKHAFANRDDSSKRMSIDEQLFERKQASFRTSVHQDGDRRRSLQPRRQTHQEAERVVEEPIDPVEEEPQESSSSVSKLTTLFENKAEIQYLSGRTMARRPSGRIARKRSVSKPRIVVVKVGQDSEVRQSNSGTAPQSSELMQSVLRRPSSKHARKQSIHNPRVADVEKVDQDDVGPSTSETEPQSSQHMDASTSDGGQRKKDEKQNKKKEKKKLTDALLWFNKKK